MANLTSIERRHLAEAIEARRRGAKLSGQQSATLAKHERQVEAERRERHYATIPQQDWIRLSGRQAKVLNDQELRYGIPVGRRVIDLRAVATWIHQAFADGRVADRAEASGEDDESEEWGRRKVRAQALLAEWELESKRQSVLPIDQARDVLDAIADQYRRLAEQLERQCGPLARKMVDATLSNCERLLERSALNGRPGKKAAAEPVARDAGGVPPSPASAKGVKAADAPRVRGRRDRAPERAAGGNKVQRGKPAGPKAPPR